MLRFASQFARHRFTRFLVLGGSAAMVNVLLMYLFVDVWNWDTPIWKNFANAISMEVSLLYSFIAYRSYVWGDAANHFQSGAWNQLIRYHGAAGFVNLIRFLAIFPLLDWIGVHHLTNTLIGIPIGCVINYFISTKFVFASSDRGVETTARDEFLNVPIIHTTSLEGPIEQLA